MRRRSRVLALAAGAAVLLIDQLTKALVESFFLDAVLQRVIALGTPLVEVTGGELQLQPAVHPLMVALLERGKTVLLETGGSLDVSGADPRVIKIVDLQCLGSGRSPAMAGEAPRSRSSSVPAPPIS